MSIFRWVRLKVVRSHMILMLSATTDAAGFAATGRTPFEMLFSQDLHGLLPEAVNTFDVHRPVTVYQQSMDTFRTKTWASPDQRRHLTNQVSFLV